MSCVITRKNKFGVFQMWADNDDWWGFRKGFRDDVQWITNGDKMLTLPKQFETLHDAKSYLKLRNKLRAERLPELIQEREAQMEWEYSIDFYDR